MRRLAVALAALAFGCADGKSTLSLHVSASGALQAIDHLRVVVTDAQGRKSHEVDVPVPGNVLPPPVDFALRLPASVRGLTTITVDALAADASTRSTISDRVNIQPSTSASLQLTLPASAGATQLAFTVEPGDVAVGGTLKPALQVTVEDAAGNRVPGATNDVTLALGANPGNATLGGTATVAASDGVATFADLTLDAKGSGYLLTASAVGLTSGSSTPFNVTAPLWVRATSGLYGGRVTWAAFDPSNKSNVYASTTGGLFRSSDGGASWKPANSGLPSRGLGTVAVDPVTPTRIIVGSDGGAAVSNNSGASWTVANSTISASETVRRLFFTGGSPNQLWAGTNAPLAYESDGASVVWISQGSLGGLPPASMHRETHGLVVDGAGDAYLATFGDGVYQLPHNTSTWTLIGAPLPRTYYDSMAIGGGVIWIGSNASGLWKGSGTTFAAVAGLPLTFVEAIGVAPSNASIVYVAGFDPGNDPIVYKTVNGGSTWAPAATGLPAARPDPTTLAIDPTDPTHALLPMPNGIYQTTNGASWSASNVGLTGWPVVALLRDPTQAGVVVAGTFGGDVFRSSDGGASWAAAAAGSTNANTLIAANGKLYLGGSGVYTSADHGATWSGTTGAQYTASLAAAPSAPMTMYAGGSSVYVSSDGGATWAASGLASTQQVNAVAVDATNAMIAYAATPDKGVFRTANGGAAWSQINGGLTPTEVLSLAVSPSNASVVFAGTGNGLYRSVDGGSNWSLTGGSAGLRVTSVVVHPTKAMQVYVSASNGGVFQSTDGGSSFVADNAGLDESYVNVVTIDAAANALWVGTTGSGVYKATP